MEHFIRRLPAEVVNLSSMDKPAYSFTLPADQAELLRKMLEQRAEQGPATPIVPTSPIEWLDMSSSEPHINNECPFCHTVWMDKVKAAGECPGCGRAYTMEEMESGQISIGWSLTPEDFAKMKGGEDDQPN